MQYPNTSMINIIKTETTDIDSFISEMRDEQVLTALSLSLDTAGQNIVTLDDIRYEGKLDSCYTTLIKTVERGFPSSRHNTDPVLRRFWEVRHRLYTVDDIVYLDRRIVIPSKLRKYILEHLHSAHQGINSMKKRANDCVYWPGISNAISNTRNNCHPCNLHAPSQSAEPLILSPSPEWPFQQICMDYFTIDFHIYIIIADRYSGWPCVYYFTDSNANSNNLIHICRELFSSYGVPEEICTDGGPQFTSHQFKLFLKIWDIHHRLSSAEYPQSNGRAEVGVKTAKRIIRDNISNDGSMNNDRIVSAFLQYKNTPLPDINLSPA